MNVEDTFFSKMKRALLSEPRPVKFSGWHGNYALFAIDKTELPNGESVSHIIVAHEGDWTDSEVMDCYDGFASYEEVQELHGKNLIYCGKEYVGVLKRTLIKYRLSCKGEAVLAVPATGEETGFEIYGIGIRGGLCLLDEREL